MKPNVRDNLIYLGVALGIVTLIIADFIYSNVRGHGMWWPSRVAVRGVYTAILLTYFVLRETKRLGSTFTQALICVLLANIVHVALVYVFRQIVDTVSGISFAALGVFEMFLLFNLAIAVARYLRVGTTTS